MKDAAIIHQALLNLQLQQKIYIINPNIVLVQSLRVYTNYILQLSVIPELHPCLIHCFASENGKCMLCFFL